MNQTRSFTIAISGLLVFSSIASGATRFAKVTATGSGNCDSWANACTLNNAIAAAVSGDRVWVKAGSYIPFNLKEGVKIIGGFAGTETSVVQSNPATNATIVDGGGTQRAVYGANQSASTMLRGFAIRNGFDGDDKGGGGLMLSDSSALIVQSIYENNTASIHGGAVMVGGPGELASPQFINCIFRNNGSTSLPYEGGAVFITTVAPVTFTNCLFYGNKGGGGGVFSKTDGSHSIFSNCTMTNNQATMTRGGAIRDPWGDVTLRNCILWGNTRIEAGSPVADQIYSPGNSAVVTYSDVEGEWPGSGNISGNPLFTNAAGNDYALQSTSPCKDTAENATLPSDVGDLNWNANSVEPVPYDLALSGRNIGTSVDMGAYEVYIAPPPPPPQEPE